MPAFVLQFLLFFSGAEVPARPEVPAGAPEYPALFFHPRIMAKSFSCFSLEGFRNFALEVSSEISGGSEFPVLGPEYPAQKIFG